MPSGTVQGDKSNTEESQLDQSSMKTLPAVMGKQDRPPASVISVLDSRGPFFSVTKAKY